MPMANNAVLTRRRPDLDVKKIRSETYIIHELFGSFMDVC